MLIVPAESKLFAPVIVTPVVAEVSEAPPVTLPAVTVGVDSTYPLLRLLLILFLNHLLKERSTLFHL
jgi:hypothetical protein